MTDFNRPPTADEMQYASDVMHGKRKRDVRITLIATVIGAFFGLLIGFAGNEAHNKLPDPVFILTCIVLVALTFAVITMLVLFTIHSIIGVCRVWIPARILVGIAILFVAYKLFQKISFWIVFPQRIMMDLVMFALLLVFAVLFVNIGIRLLFLLYCMVTGKDEEKIMVEQLSAKHDFNSKK